MSLFSPLDTRYALMLPASLSEENATAAQAEVEAVWLHILMDRGFCKDKVPLAEIRRLFEGITPDEIEHFEKTTRHATRALVETLAARLTKAGHAEAARWVHVGLTSFDTVDTAQRLRVKAFFQEAGFKALADLQQELKRWAETHRETPQAGRTHGQWAVPSFFGLHFAEAYHRSVVIEKRLRADVEDLRGQASGAVGGYQATSLLVDDPLHLESEFLSALGLKPHYGSTQILPPEDILFVAQDWLAICSVATKVANDLRHLARSEVGEIAEGMAPGQVGSSTMPQKRNPWNLEHVCSLWKVMLSRLQLIENDLISEHQRDLTNSASGRFHLEVFAVGYLLITRLTKVLKTLEADPKNMRRHLDAAGASVFAEAFYVSLTKDGVDDAHGLVREASRAAEKKGTDLLQELRERKLVDAGLTPDILRAKALKGSALKLKAILEREI
jgi:adenylosuccinate lyase